jgi:hypothetical protein
LARLQARLSSSVSTMVEVPTSKLRCLRELLGNRDLCDPERDVVPRASTSK